MHIYVDHLLFKLERNGAYPDGPGQLVTCSGKSFVLKKRSGMQQLNPQLHSGHPIYLARRNFYKPLFTSTLIAIICYPNKCIFMNMAVEL
jgi:hypothetical protein